MKFHMETINQFELILSSLDSNNNNLIRALSLFAEQHKQNSIVASAFVDLVNLKISQSPPQSKIYSFYVLDCIVKSVGCLYIELFSKTLKRIFLSSLSSLADDTDDKWKYFSMRKSWQNHFPLDILLEIDEELDKIDRDWRSDRSPGESRCLPGQLAANRHRISLQSLPIINSRRKSDNNNRQPIDNDDNNDDYRSPIVVIGPVASWNVDIPDYPLFPDIGTDPRLLRRWIWTGASGASRSSHRISIEGGVSLQLLLDRIQPCVEINGELHAVRFNLSESRSIKLMIDEGGVFEIGPVGVTRISVAGWSCWACLGGPGHELIVAGIPYHVPIDGLAHRVWINRRPVSMRWVATDGCGFPVPVSVMPAIPDHIARWGWMGFFGSSRLLHHRPLNPMRRVSQNLPATAPRRRVLAACDDNKFRRKSEEKKTDVKDEEEAREENVNRSDYCWEMRNYAAVEQMYEDRRCLSCDRVMSYGDRMGFLIHLKTHCLGQRGWYQSVNDWVVSEIEISTTEKASLTDSNSENSLDPNKKSSFFNDLIRMEAEVNAELMKWTKLELKREEIIKFTSSNSVTICVTNGTAEMYGTSLPFNIKMDLKLNNYEILSFTGCKIYVKGDLKDIILKSFKEEFFKANTLINVHYDLELKRIKALHVEGRGPRILVYGPGVEPFSMSTLTRTLANYSVRCGRTVALVNLDTTYNDTGLPNSISANVIQAEFEMTNCWDFLSDPLVFSFGHCSPVANQKLYFEQLEALANLVNIRCENDNQLLSGGCIINGGSFHYSDIIVQAIQLFEVDVLLFISDQETANLKPKVAEYVGIINIPRKHFDTSYCPKKIEGIRKNRIESYFYGNGIVKNDYYYRQLNASDMTIYCSNSSNFVEIDLEGIFVNSIGALSQAVTKDQINSSPIFLYFVIVNVSINTNTITVMSHQEQWPHGFSIILLNGLSVEKNSIEKMLP